MAKSKDSVLERFGVTEAQLDRLEAEAAQGILHSKPRGEVVRYSYESRLGKGQSWVPEWE